MEKHVTQLLFVYGTLLLSENQYGQFLSQNSIRFAKGWFPGELFDLGNYPGAVIDHEKDEFVFGTIYKMNDTQHVLGNLDYYEGLGEVDCEYERMLIEVKTDGGAYMCYSYVYIHSTSDKTKIPGGDYLSYLEYKR